MPDNRFSLSDSASLYNYSMNLREHCVWDGMLIKLHAKQKAMGVDMTPAEYPGMGYSEKYGYFHAVKNDIGICSVEFCTMNEDEMVMRFLASSAFAFGLRSELYRRAELRKSWHYYSAGGEKIENRPPWKHDMIYDFRKYCFEQEIYLLSRAFPLSELGRIIESRKNLLNKQSAPWVWDYDEKRMEFVESHI